MDDSLISFFTEHSSAIRKSWFKALVSEYPEESARHIGSSTDEFANPIGHVIGEVADSMVKGLAEGAPASELAERMFPLIKIKAVQSFTPAEAMNCLLALKRMVLSRLKTSGHEDAEAIAASVDLLFDEMLCLCFNLYCQCRDKLHEVKEDELKRNLFMLLKRSGALDESGQGEV